MIVYDNHTVDSRLQARWGFASVVLLPGPSILFDTGGGQPHPSPQHAHPWHRSGRDRYRRDLAHPRRLRNSIGSRSLGCETCDVPRRIAERVYTTGEMENAPREQALVVEMGDGLVVITGCAHPGILSIVRRVKSMRTDADVSLVMGGFHLLSASAEQLEGTTDHLQELGLRRVAPSHCSGDACRDVMRRMYGEDCLVVGAGSVIPLPD